jgi:hypothetical protein
VLDRRHDANPASRDGGSGVSAALPVNLRKLLSVAELRDATLGVGDAWNHDVLLCAIARLGHDPILRFHGSEHIVRITDPCTELR